MKPFISLKDLMLLLPVVTIGYALLYLLAVAYGHGPIPPASQLLDNLTLILWAWTTLFAVNFALAVSWTLRERRERRERLARQAARRAARQAAQR